MAEEQGSGHQEKPSQARGWPRAVSLPSNLQTGSLGPSWLRVWEGSWDGQVHVGSGGGGSHPGGYDGGQEDGYCTGTRFLRSILNATASCFMHIRPRGGRRAVRTLRGGL